MLFRSIVSVLFGTAMAAITIKIGKALFQKEYARLFVVLVCFLPGAMFINSYINTDSIALFSTAWVVWCWVKAVKKQLE